MPAQPTTPTETLTPTQPAAHLLDVPGARLHYTTRGSGPLLLVVGQPMTSEPFAPLADVLAEHHTVVTYDPRGLGRSAVDDDELDVTPEIQADDLARIIDAVGGGPADVFGSSGGAQTVLALAARHPDRVRTVVAHEPPVAELLPDARHVRAVVDDIEAAYRSSGAGAAWGTFVSLVMFDGELEENGVPPVAWPPAGAPGAGPDDDETVTPDAGDAAAPSSQEHDDRMFFLRLLKPFARWQPPVDVLRTLGPRVVIAVGEASRGEVARRSADALARNLGTTPASFPGHHGGFMDDPAAFADRLGEVLAAAR